MTFPVKVKVIIICYEGVNLIHILNLNLDGVLIVCSPSVISSYDVDSETALQSWDIRVVLNKKNIIWIKNL